MVRSTSRLTLAAAAVLLSAVNARADIISWTYNAEPSAPTIASDTNPGSRIMLKDDPLVQAAGSTDIVLTNLTTVSTADPNKPDQFSKTGAWSLSVLITDSASGKSKTVTFTGKLGGTLSGLSAGITNTFTGTTKFDFVLGNNEYVVTAGMYSPPGPPNASNKGSISAHVDVSPAGGGGTQKAPEPSTLLLAVFGLAGLGAARGRRRRHAVG
jgi:hypothetical protein